MSFKDKVREKIKLYSNEEHFDGYIKSEFITDDGSANIFMKLSSRNELFDSRSMDQQLDLKKSIYEFIEDKLSMLDNDIQITLHIVGLNLNSKDKEIVKHLLKEHYARKLYEKQKEYATQKNKTIRLLLLGIIFLAIYLLFYLYTKFEFFKTVLVFLFTFSLWEAFDNFMNSYNDVKIERETITQELLIEVVFDDKKEKSPEIL